MKIVYRRDNKTCVVNPISKERLEKELGPLNNAQYLEVIRRAVPADATDVVEVNDVAENPAMLDVVNGAVVVNLVKAKDVGLFHIRNARNIVINKTDSVVLMLNELVEQNVVNAPARLARIKEIRAELRNITEDLKALDVSQGAVDDVLPVIKRKTSEAIDRVNTLGQESV